MTTSLSLAKLREMHDDLGRLLECLPAGTVGRLVCEMQRHSLEYLIAVCEDAGADQLTSAVLSRA